MTTLTKKSNFTESHNVCRYIFSDSYASDLHINPINEPITKLSKYSTNFEL